MAPDDDYHRGKVRLAELARQRADEGSQGRNEATTRLQLIDALLFEGLGWPSSQVVSEARLGGTYTDYSLGLPTRLIVEAKREDRAFDLPLGVGPGILRLGSVLDDNPELQAAVRQVTGYCHDRGVALAAVSNGHQLVAFVASRQDGVPPMSGKALVFDSLTAMSASFRLLWDNLSPLAVEALTLHTTLGDRGVEPPPAKLSTRIPNYPGYWGRNKIQTELKILGDLVLQDIVTAPDLEEAFLRQCYATTGTLSEYALVSREILESRYSALTAAEAEASLSPARTKQAVNDDFASDLLAGALSRRPLILLGDVGVGKSLFIRHFVRIDAAEVMQRSIVLSINFGGEPALADDLNEFVRERLIEQLQEYDVDIFDDKFVRGVYQNELKFFERSIYRKLKTTRPDEYERREIELLERKLGNEERHLQASLRYASKTLRKQIVLFLDNIDQRDFDFQEKVFLIGQSLAESWPATVFLSLRPDTFFRSRNVGSLTAYQPRVFTIAPPDAGKVIEKRLRFCRGIVDSEDERSRILPEALSQQADLLSRYLRVVETSFRDRNELVEFVENLSGGNIRAALGFLNTFVGSGHVDTGRSSTSSISPVATPSPSTSLCER